MSTSKNIRASRKMCFYQLASAGSVHRIPSERQASLLYGIEKGPKEFFEMSIKFSIHSQTALKINPKEENTSTLR